MNLDLKETSQKVNYILRMERRGRQTVYRLHNLASGERWMGGSWEELRDYLERVRKPRLK